MSWLTDTLTSVATGGVYNPGSGNNTNPLSLIMTGGMSAINPKSTYDALSGISVNNLYSNWIDSMGLGTNADGSPKDSIWGGARSIVENLDGRASSRIALAQSQQQFNDAQAQAQSVIAQSNWNKQQSDILTSTSAGAATATAKSQGGLTYSNATPMALGPGSTSTPMAGRDFLGL
jgi:hypothetical protein